MFPLMVHRVHVELHINLTGIEVVDTEDDVDRIMGGTVHTHLNKQSFSRYII